jgi:hypothetical protein
LGFEGVMLPWFFFMFMFCVGICALEAKSLVEGFNHLHQFSILSIQAGLGSGRIKVQFLTIELGT